MSSFHPYHVDIQSIIDSYAIPDDNSTSVVQRDPANSENLTDEIRWLLIQSGPYQPRDHLEHFTKSSHHGKGTIRFQVKWFDDIRFANWLEYSFSTSRAYCFYCRLFADSNRNRAFSRDGKSTFHFIFISLEE